MNRTHVSPFAVIASLASIAAFACGAPDSPSEPVAVTPQGLATACVANVNGPCDGGTVDASNDASADGSSDSAPDASPDATCTLQTTFGTSARPQSTCLGVTDSTQCADPSWDDLGAQQDYDPAQFPNNVLDGLPVAALAPMAVAAPFDPTVASLPDLLSVDFLGASPPSAPAPGTIADCCTANCFCATIHSEEDAILQLLSKARQALTALRSQETDLQNAIDTDNAAKDEIANNYFGTANIFKIYTVTTLKTLVEVVPVVGQWWKYECAAQKACQETGKVTTRVLGGLKSSATVLKKGAIGASSLACLQDIVGGSIPVIGPTIDALKDCNSKVEEIQKIADQINMLLPLLQQTRQQIKQVKQQIKALEKQYDDLRALCP